MGHLWKGEKEREKTQHKMKQTMDGSTTCVKESLEESLNLTAEGKTIWAKIRNIYNEIPNHFCYGENKGFHHSFLFMRKGFAHSNGQKKSKFQRLYNCSYFLGAVIESIDKERIQNQSVYLFKRRKNWH